MAPWKVKVYGLATLGDEVVRGQSDFKLTCAVVFPHQVFKPVLTQRRQGFWTCDDG